MLCVARRSYTTNIFQIKSRDDKEGVNDLRRILPNVVERHRTSPENPSSQPSARTNIRFVSTSPRSGPPATACSGAPRRTRSNQRPDPTPSHQTREDFHDSWCAAVPKDTRIPQKAVGPRGRNGSRGRDRGRVCVAASSVCIGQKKKDDPRKGGGGGQGTGEIAVIVETESGARDFGHIKMNKQKNKNKKGTQPRLGSCATAAELLHA